MRQPPEQVSQIICVVFIWRKIDGCNSIRSCQPYPRSLHLQCHLQVDGLKGNILTYHHCYSMRSIIKCPITETFDNVHNILQASTNWVTKSSQMLQFLPFCMNSLTVPLDQGKYIRPYHEVAPCQLHRFWQDIRDADWTVLAWPRPYLTGRLNCQGFDQAIRVVRKIKIKQFIQQILQNTKSMI